MGFDHRIVLRRSCLMPQKITPVGTIPVQLMSGRVALFPQQWLLYLMDDDNVLRSKQRAKNGLGRAVAYFSWLGRSMNRSSLSRRLGPEFLVSLS